MERVFNYVKLRLEFNKQKLITFVKQNQLPVYEAKFAQKSSPGELSIQIDEIIDKI